jgi:hypothetical protein
MHFYTLSLADDNKKKKKGHKHEYDDNSGCNCDDMKIVTLEHEYEMINWLHDSYIDNYDIIKYNCETFFTVTEQI